MPTTPPRSSPTEVFISYAHKDTKLKDRLVSHLASMEHEGLITSWVDHKITAGSKWVAEIDKHLSKARIILLLVSADFLASDYAFGIEFRRAMELHKLRQAVVIPIILRPCLWQNTPIGDFNVLPDNAKPVVQWNNIDDALLNVAKGIKRALKELAERRPQKTAIGEVSEPTLQIPYDVEGEITEIILRCKGSPNNFPLQEFRRSLRDEFGVVLERITISIQQGSVKIVIEGDAEELSKIINGLFDPKVQEEFARRQGLISVSYTQDRQQHYILMKPDEAAMKAKAASAHVTPKIILDDAIRAVPAVRYALGVAGVAAAVAIVAGFSIDYKVAVLGTIIMFALMFGLVAFSSFASTSAQSVRPLALFLAWTFVLLIASSSFCIFTGFFFSWPRSLGSYIPQPSPTPIQIVITDIPPYGSGPDSITRIAGTVSGVRSSDYHVIIYSFTNMWYVQPEAVNPKTQINADGTWSADIHGGTRYVAILVPRDYKPPSTTSTLPTRLAGVVAATEVESRR